MDKNTNRNYNSDTEVVNGNVTSKSYKIYSEIQDPKKRYNFRSVLLFLPLIVLVVLSVFIFANSIKTAFFDEPKESEELEDSFVTIKIKYDNNDTVKVENVTKEISKVFGIPVGVKIVDISEDLIVESGLRINDIIVRVDNTNVTTIDELNKAIETVNTEDYITYTIYRNGMYKNIDYYADLYE